MQRPICMLHYLSLELVWSMVESTVDGQELGMQLRSGRMKQKVWQRTIWISLGSCFNQYKKQQQQKLSWRVLQLIRQTVLHGAQKICRNRHCYSSARCYKKLTQTI